MHTAAWSIEISCIVRGMSKILIYFGWANLVNVVSSPTSNQRNELGSCDREFKIKHIFDSQIFLITGVFGNRGCPGSSAFPVSNWNTRRITVTPKHNDRAANILCFYAWLIHICSRDWGSNTSLADSISISLSCEIQSPSKSFLQNKNFPDSKN